MTHPHPFLLKTALALVTFLITIPGVSIATETPATDSSNDRHGLFLDDGAWINEIGSLLFDDLDGDGYFSGLSLSIDADSSYNQYSVYVVIDIVDEFNQAERFHTTRSFDVYGRSFSDEYRIDIDLVQNYSPGIYDLRVILVDAFDHRVLDQVDASNFRNLRALPLESRDNQSFHSPVSNRPVSVPNDDIQVTEYAGSTGFGVLALLASCGLFRMASRNTRAQKARD